MRGPPDQLDECELQADGTSDVEHSEPNVMFEAQRENGNQDAEADQQRLSEVEGELIAKTVALKYSKRLLFDVELPTHGSEEADECAITHNKINSPDYVPLPHCSLPGIVSEGGSESVGCSTLLQPSVNVSASCDSNFKMFGAMDNQKGFLAVRLRPLPRKCTVNRSSVKKIASKTSTSKVKKEKSEASDEQVSHMNSVESNKADSVCYAQTDANCPQSDGGDEGRKIGSLVDQTSQNNLKHGANGTLRPSLDTQQLECQLNPETYSCAVLGRAKRGVELDCDSQDLVKRKRLTANKCTKDTKRQELLNVASDGGILRRPLNEVVSTNPIVDKEETLKPARKRQAASKRANTKGKGGQEMQLVLNTRTESSSDAMHVCSLDESSVVSENHQKDGSCKVKPPSGPCKRLKTRSNSMDVETTSTKQTEQEPLPEVLVRPAIQLLQSTSRRRNINNKPLKRKSPTQASSTTESDNALVSTSALSMEPLELKPTDCNTVQDVQEESLKKGLNQPSKRPKIAFRVSDKSPASGGIQETKQCIYNLHLMTKEDQPKEGTGKISVDPIYFEMTPFESDQQPVPSCLQHHLVSCSVQLDNEVKHVIDGKERSTASVSDEVEASNHSSMSVSGLRSSARRINIKPRRADNQRSKCRVLRSWTRKGEEVKNSITTDDADQATSSSRSSGNALSRRLLRSYSCPEIPSLRPQETPWPSTLPSPHHSRMHTTHHHQSSHTPSVHHALKSLRRARRHTVCSVEVEREIAPLCLRKEVYPSRRSLSSLLSPSLTLSPSTSLSALASCFLSSPLAFLSKKVDSRGAAASPNTPSHVSSPTSSSFLYPSIPIQRIDDSQASLEYSSSGKCEIESRRQSEEEEDDGEDTSSSSQEFEDVGLREEKSLSDSEIKVVQKREERGKVSSIRIRKTLPKPQNNLTPMGLPKPIRLKKKEFSLEEIYTNKNFSKPPESRLETIFEVPLNRRNGSESSFGQRRFKRFLEFLDAGEARRPKKPLVGVGKAGISSSRTRRGGFPKDEPSLSAQDVDSLLCSKLEQLNLWLIHDQKER
ncbi:uncharacterized protein prr14 [Cottoperca gobio]|uniref:Uncharacterized protein prr14 n=1 Tax=Cottoperca gobio TaxID=56716 RepID=A0A6J2Q6C7_COTGO|nr:uncharacterized protein LOC115012488 [Cottoperca gobio]